MKLRLALQRHHADTVDIEVTCDATTTVGDVARFLAAADPVAPQVDGPAPTLAVVQENSRLINPDTLVAESGLRSGKVVAVGRAGQRYQDPQAPTAAVLKVVSGPDTGREFALATGSSVVGRGAGCQVLLGDPLVSRQHVRVNVTDSVEVIDLGSANGLVVNDEADDRVIVRAEDRVTIGDTTFMVSLRQLAGTKGRAEPVQVGFIRSPRLVRPYPGEKIEAPAPPQPVHPQRLPVMMLVTPLLMAGFMWLFTQNILSLAFMALSPLFFLGSWADERINGRRVTREQAVAYRDEIAMLSERLTGAGADEVAARLIEHPSVGECAAAAGLLSPLLWTRRSDSPGFAEFRLGLGSLPSRTVVEIAGKDGRRDLLAEMLTALRPFRTVHGVPVVARPAVSGGLGVAGAAAVSGPAARALIAQAVTLHSPNDLVLAAVASSRTSAQWEWLKWLPHTGATHSPLAGPHLAETPQGANRLVAEIEGVLAARSAQRVEVAHVFSPLVLLLVEADAPVEFARLVALAENGWRHGVLVVWVAPELAQLPASCRTFLDLTTPLGPDAGYLHVGELVTPVAVESLSANEAEVMARQLSPLIDLAIPSEDSSDLPRTVSYLSLAGADLAERDAAVIERWQETRSLVTGPFAPEVLARRSGNLRALIGQSAAGPFSLDLRTDGPHALVGGTTGSGKSELLQTWILAMAAAHSPQRLTFLLVDYKGGSAFSECNELPHTVGLVTDLNTNGVRRALTSLAAELRYREHLLASHDAKDLIEMEKSHPKEAPPALVLVVDEFAALVTEVPEFVDGVVNVAQRGRSLGLHLILATQRPAGVIKDNLRANTNLRLALRVADIDDSNDVLGSPVAAYFDSDLPGRAVSKTGPGRLLQFQTAYAGGHSGQVARTQNVTVVPIGFGTPIAWEPPVVAEVAVGDPGPSDISRVVTTITRAFATAQVPHPRRPWMPELKAHYPLAGLPTARRDDELVYGVLDDPDSQEQPTVAFHPDSEGNLAVVGTGGSGKSTLLRTLAAAAGFTIRGGPCHVYGLDYGSRGLGMLEDLPHVGSIIAAGDDERVRRLMKWLRAEVEQRAVRYAGVNAGSITEYRRLADAPNEPRILLMVDNLAAFRSAFDVARDSWVVDNLVSIATEGRAVGVHLVLSMDRLGAMPTALAAAVQRTVVLRLAGADDYAYLGVPADILTAESPPGRGIVDDREVQVALLGDRIDTPSQAAAMKAFGRSMVKAGIGAAQAIRRLPDRVLLADLPATLDGQPVLGLESESLDPLAFPPVGSFIVTGPPASGRSTTVLAMLAALRRQDPTWRVVLFTARKNGLATSGFAWTASAIGVDPVTELAEKLTSDLTAAAERSTALGRVAVVLENPAELAQGAMEDPLTALVGLALGNDLFVISEGEETTLNSSYGLLGALKATRYGLSLQPDGSTDSVYRTEFPMRLQRASFPEGRGLFVRRGRTSTVQVALPYGTE